MADPITLGLGGLAAGAAAKGVMHAAAWLHRIDAQLLVKRANKHLGKQQKEFDERRASLREILTKYDAECKKEIAQFLEAYGRYLEEELILPSDFPAKIKKIPPPKLPSLAGKDSRPVLEKVFSSSVELPTSAKYAITHANQHPTAGMFAMLAVAGSLLKDGYMDHKDAREVYGAAARYEEECRQRCETLLAALEHEAERIQDFFRLNNNYRWRIRWALFLTNTLKRDWNKMWPINQHIIRTVYGIDLELHNFMRETLETL